MKRVWITLIAAGLLTIAAVAPAAAQESLSLDLNEVDDSGIAGGVHLSSDNGSTFVEVLITAGLEDGAVHPVHIHEGTCADLGGVAWPLEDIVGGVSETTLDIELGELMAGEYAINAHLSEDEMAVNVACANIPEGGVGGPAADDDEAVDDVDDAVEDDEATDDEAVEEEPADDDVEDVTPNAGSTGGISGDAMVLIMAGFAGAALVGGVLVRRLSTRAVYNP